MDKVVVVTGAAGGLGSQVARHLASEGAQLVITDKAGERLEQLAADLIGQRRSVLFQLADSRHFEQVVAVTDAAVNRWGRIDALINVAGGTLAQLMRKEDPPVWDQTEEEWDLVVDVNLKGSFNWVKAVAPHMMKVREGHVVLIASGTGIRPVSTGMSAYAAAKAGVIGFMKAVARDLGPFNIRVNAIAPGLTLHSELHDSRATIESYTADTMLGRLSTFDDFAAFVVHLIQMSAISGQTINLDSRVLM